MWRQCSTSSYRFSRSHSPILWFGGALILFIRYRAQQIVYLRQFPPVEPHVTFDMYTSMYGAPRGTRRWINQMVFKHQADPELEALRRAMWRRFGLYALWVFGFPLLTLSVAVLLTLAGLIHPH